eukprot:CAMPEP_0197904406 /NCGR_PEP_ID=MMETSP1439-20131203/58005_1 /TAXON_ID=66791 /ORGANISM="Gonyaulax spinifera, Strain CCMP409" /LENGTH=152 /DNA_ID=CAMNT_0043525599 /DNA_START=1 /DNA_END=456 /DNA_ORIENTATION=+
MVVMSGFYVQADPEGAAAVRALCEAAAGDAGVARPILALTVGAHWCCRVPAVQEIASVADFVFSNEPEVAELAAAIAGQEDAAASGAGAGGFEAALTAVASWKRRGWMVATRGGGSLGAVKAQSSGRPLLVPVDPLAPEKFVDDVGAGDAFM